jgi:hypothetical protein
LNTFTTKTRYLFVRAATIILTDVAVSTDNTVALHSIIVILRHKSTYGTRSVWVPSSVRNLAIRKHLPFWNLPYNGKYAIFERVGCFHHMFYPVPQSPTLLIFDPDLPPTFKN